MTLHNITASTSVNIQDLAIACCFEPTQIKTLWQPKELAVTSCIDGLVKALCQLKKESKALCGCNGKVKCSIHDLTLLKSLDDGFGMLSRVLNTSVEPVLIELLSLPLNKRLVLITERETATRSLNELKKTFDLKHNRY